MRRSQTNDQVTDSTRVSACSRAAIAACAFAPARHCRRVGRVKRRLAIAAGSGRDLRLAVFGGCCTALGARLPAAGGLRRRIRHAPNQNARQESSLPAPVAARPQSAPIESTSGAQTRSRSADRTRHGRACAQRFAMPGCDYNPSVQHWTRMYAQAPNEFASSLSEAMPYPAAGARADSKSTGCPANSPSCRTSKATTRRLPRAAIAPPASGS